MAEHQQGKSIWFMQPINLKLVDKSAMQVEFDEKDEKGFCEGSARNVPKLDKHVQVSSLSYLPKVPDTMSHVFIYWMAFALA